MEGYKLSFVVPMYNAEKYIVTCLDTILHSALPKELYDVVVVNDGSTDSSPDIAQLYAQQHENITYLTQENQGQSVARNLGIKSCKGDYVWCIDADDKLDRNELPKVFSTLEEHEDLDILAVQLQRISEQDEPICIECEQPSLPHGEMRYGSTGCYRGIHPSSVWCADRRKKALFC